MAKIWGRILAVTGIIACPCHLPLTLPLLLGVLAGTGLGSFVATHTGLIYGVATGYFVVGLAGGLLLLNRWRGQAKASCDIPPSAVAPPGTERRELVEDRASAHPSRH